MTKTRWALLAMIALIGARLALPSLARREVNETLATLSGYAGHVRKVRLSLLRGRIALDSVEIWDKKKDFRLEIPSLNVDIAWKPLLRRRFVADIAVSRPSVHMLTPKPSKTPQVIKQKAKKAEVTIERKTGKSLPDLLADLLPFRIDRLTIEDGTVQVKTEGAEEGPEMRLSRIAVVIENMTNFRADRHDRFAKGTAEAALMENGKAALKLKLDPTAKQPTFDLSLEVRQFDLRAMNPVLRLQWDVDVRRGTFEMFSEVAAADGRFKGYVKPFIEGLEMGDERKGPVKAIKEAVAGAAAVLLKNKETEAVATRVPFEGRFEDPKTGTWEAVMAVLRNAFVEALKPRLGKD